MSLPRFVILSKAKDLLSHAALQHLREKQAALIR
jgi:hypothetical protein